LQGDWMTRLSFAQESVLVLLWGILISAGLLQLRPGPAILAAAGAFCLFALVAVWIQGRFHVWFSWLDPAGVQTAIAMIWSVGFQYTLATRRQRKLRRAFASYLSPYMAERIANSDFDLSLGGSEVEATVMFTDLEGFSNMTETLPPKEVSHLLISYFQETSRAILDQDGTIIKYIGDAVMAVWGAPLADPRPNQRAVLAALGIRRAGRYEFAGRRLRTRCGINSGLVLAGNLGSDYRFDYTLIGETTNLASRLEGLNKYLGTDIVISDSVRRGLDGTILVRNLGRFIFSGATRPIEVYEVVGLAAEFQPSPPWLDLFAQARAHFTKREFDEAEKLLQETLTLHGGEDGPTKFYLKQIAHDRTVTNSTVPWDGLIRLDSK
jgi:adenylate cyclase